MKNFRLALCLLATILTLALATSCSGPKQVFYFQHDPAMPKVAAQKANPEPIYSASNTPNLPDLTQYSLATTETKSGNTASTNLTKKDLRKLLRKTLKNIKDTTDNRGRNRRITMAVNKDRIGQLESEARNFKNSVKVQNDENKVTVDMKKSIPEFSQTEWILLGVAALLVLLILLSLPVIGTILGVVLALAIIALGVALLTGYIDINL
jgi:hypothetical protein